ncbi:2-nitropropane dioxygenase [Lysinibacillus xylanilyticus]|uniref:Probable nitronate monooxygenase n=1 Tax=Lysinibacillus xylanilyticus TaxID=582475 RepID=A0A0K9FE18_9BACI|nr:nitronate monooxygenase [Lysinibacillus xylanilyticus]KMY32438.1 2-nitropropane dioxygenase [Lysinibacillus xylanilyticus]
MNQLCSVLAIKYPIIQGGMGNISSPKLVAAVSNAGGLGTIGCGTMTPVEVEKRIVATKQLTQKPFALNVPINVSPYTKELLQLAITHKVPVVSLSAGNPTLYIEKLHAHHIRVIAVVASVKHAIKAEQGGADVIVAEGFEAAGINSNLELTTFTLIPQVVDAVSVPVVVAGGVGDGRGLAASFMLGAAGVQMGTRFIATQEMPVHPAYKQRLLDATDVETVILGRSIGQVRRVLCSPYASSLLADEANGIKLADYQERTSETYHIKGAIEGNEQGGFMNSGQIAGIIQELPTVATLIETMMDDAQQCLNRTLLNHFTDSVWGVQS